MSRKTSRT